MEYFWKENKKFVIAVGGGLVFLMLYYSFVLGPIRKGAADAATERRNAKRDIERRMQQGVPTDDALLAARRDRDAIGERLVLCGGWFAMRRDAFYALGGFDERFVHVSDWDLWLRLAGHGAAACVNEALVGYRMHAANASLRTAEMLAELGVLERRHGLTRTRRHFHRHLAHLSLRTNRLRDALAHFSHALLHFRDGYNRLDFEMDWRLVREHAGEIVRRRLRLAPSKRAIRRLEAARNRDPNAAWKAAAREWLGELQRPDVLRDKSV